MRFEDEYYNRKSGNLKIVLGCLTAATFFAVILFLVLSPNIDKISKKHKNVKISENAVDAEENDEEFHLSGNKKTAEELDFWHMYDENDADVSKKQNLDDPDMNKKEYNQTPSQNDIDLHGVDPADETVSGNFFNASDSEDAEPVEIFDSIPKNNYIAGAFRQEGNELQYYSSSRKVSSYGVDVSKYQGDIDWALVKESGINFAMIRMGVRGYSTGNVVLDEKFVENVENALKNGIDVGVYFYSQAITLDEAVEEANYAVAAVSKFPIAYPIVFYSEEIKQDTARTDNLNMDELTAIADKFCETVASYGYRPMISASKERLAKWLDMSVLSKYDTWLLDAPRLKKDQKLRMSDYPYQYTMWQYSTDGHVAGIEGSCDLNISFVDYKYR